MIKLNIDCTTADLQTLCRKCHETHHAPKVEMSRNPFNAKERHEKWLQARKNAARRPLPKGKLAKAGDKLPKIRY